MSTNIHHRVATRSYSGRHLLEIGCVIEQKTINGSQNFSDVVFFEMSPEYNRAKRITMQLGAIDLRCLGYALKEMVKNGSSRFNLFTDPKTAGRSGEIKSLTLGSKETTLFINLSSGRTEIGFSMNAHFAAALSDALTLLAEETEKALYHHQRQHASSRNV